MKPHFLPLAAAALGLAACSGSNTEPTAANGTELNFDEGADANLSVDEGADLNAGTVTLNEGEGNAAADPVGNLIEGNAAETSGNAQ